MSSIKFHIKKNLKGLFFLAFCLSNVFSQTPLQGPIDTYLKLEKSKSPYLVNELLLITESGTLESEAGVQVIIDSASGTQVIEGDTVRITGILNQGTINIVGAENDMVQFYFAETTNDSGWIGIQNSSSVLFNLDYVSVKNATAGVGFYNSSGSLSNCEINHNGIGVVIGADWDVVARDKFELNVDNCQINFNKRGLVGVDSVFLNVFNSQFTDNSYAGISIDDYVHAYLVNNLLKNNDYGMRGDNFNQVTLINNTVIYNNIGLYLSDAVVPILYNNIIAYNSELNFRFDASFNTEIYHNLIIGDDSLNNISGDTLPGFLANSQLNVNGDSTDAYGNLSLPILFTDSTGFSFENTSPIFNAGVKDIYIESEVASGIFIFPFQITIVGAKLSLCEADIGAKPDENICATAAIEKWDHTLMGTPNTDKAKYGVFSNTSKIPGRFIHDVLGRKNHINRNNVVFKKYNKE